MATCPSCFTERSDTGACFCEDPAALVVKGPAKFTPVDEPKKDLLTDAAMSDDEVIRTARSLLDEHDLKNVRLEWMNSTKKLGECQFFKGVGSYGARAYKIRFSRTLFKHMSRSEQMETITHEIAHALTPGHHHDAIWAAKHRSLGGKARRCSKLPESVLAATSKWIGTCPNGHKRYRAQRSDRMFQVTCADCDRRWNPNYYFEWKAQW